MIKYLIDSRSYINVKDTEQSSNNTKYVTPNALERCVEEFAKKTRRANARLKEHDIKIMHVKKKLDHCADKIDQTNMLKEDVEDLVRESIDNYDKIEHLKLTMMWMLLIEIATGILSFASLFN